MAERLRGRVAVEPFAGPVEPAPDPDVVVRAAKVPGDEGEKVEPGGNRVRRGAVAGNVAPRTGLGDAEEAGQQFHAQDALQDAPFVRGSRGLVEGFVDLLQERGEPDGIGAGHPVKFRKEAAADTGFGHARLEPLDRGIVQAGDGAQEQAHRVGAHQRPDGCGGKPRVVEWTANGLDMEIRHSPNVCHGCGRVNADWTGLVRVPYGAATRSLSMLSPMRAAEAFTVSRARWA